MAEQMTVLQVSLDDRPGALAAPAEAIGSAGVNIEAVLGYSAGGESAAQFVVADAGAARSALERSQIRVVGERTVLVVPIEDRPGALAEVTRTIAGAGINLTLVYLATGNRLMIGADDIPALARLL